jgi:hypothetical protein
MTMELGYLLTLHFSILYLGNKIKNSKLYFLVDGEMYPPQVLKFS